MNECVCEHLHFVSGSMSVCVRLCVFTCLSAYMVCGGGVLWCVCVGGGGDVMRVCGGGCYSCVGRVCYGVY